MPRKLSILNDLQTPDNASEFYQNYLAYDSLLQSDKIIQKYGRGTFTYYDDMTDSDCVISGALESRIKEVTALEWSVEPASEDEGDIEIAKFINDIFANMDLFHEYLENIMGSLRNGFSVQIVNWELKNDYLIPKELLSSNPDYFRFDTLRRLRVIDTPGEWEGRIVEDYRFLLNSFQSRYSNPYGVSILRPIYWAWWFKHHGMKWWLQAAERGAVVTPVGKYSRNASDEERKALVEACKLFKGNQYIVTLDENTVEFPHITVDSELTRLLVETLDEAIRYRIEGSVLASGTADSGTRALGEVHAEKSQIRIESDAKALMVTINRLVQWIMDLNYANVDYPHWKLHYQPDADTTAIRENIKVIVPLGAKISASKVVEMMGLPQAAEGEDILVAPGTDPLTGQPAIAIPKEEAEDNTEGDISEDETTSDDIDNAESLDEDQLKKKHSQKNQYPTELDEIMKGWSD